jgi:hypothetical protein
MMKKLLRRLRAARSAYRLFFKIFLWFWLTIWVVFLFVVISNHFTGMHEVKQPNMYATVMPILAAQAVHGYETGGQEEFARFSHEHVDDEERTVYLLDGFRSGRAPPADLGQRDKDGASREEQAIAHA